LKLTKISVEKALTKAKMLIAKGEPDDARHLLQSVLNMYPNNRRAQKTLKHLQTIQQKKIGASPPGDFVNKLLENYNRGNFSTVIQDATQLILKYPDAYEIWNMMGACYARLGVPDKSLEAFKKVIVIKPDYAEGYNNIANLLKERGDLNEAASFYRTALSINPDYAAAYYNLGNVFKEQNNLEEAVKAFEKATQIRPNYTEAWLNLGVAFFNQNKLKQALLSFKKTLEIQPTNVEAWNNIGTIHKAFGKIDEALSAYTSALKNAPEYVDALNNIGALFSEIGRTNEGLVYIRKALSLEPNNATSFSNMGNALKQQGEVDQAIQAYEQAILINNNFPDAHHNLSYALLNVGRVEEGLKEFEWRVRVPHLRSNLRHFSQPQWTRTVEGKRLLLWSDQGIGDIINWSHKIPIIASRVDHIVLECPKKLVPLLSRSFPDIEVKAEDRTSDKVRNDFDFHLPMGSLYLQCFPEIGSTDAFDAFLKPNLERVKYWRARLASLGDGPYVGIGWKSSKMTADRMPEYADINEWAPIFHTPNVTFINLQYSDFASDLQKIQTQFGVVVHNFEELDLFDDIDDVAALSAALDIVVATTSAIPFISAGVGTATKLALWRQSPWNNCLFHPVGPRVQRFERDTWEPWESTFSQISNQIHEGIDSCSFDRKILNM
jgi:tetratricopeptide (TPR) repeat protein